MELTQLTGVKKSMFNEMKFVKYHIKSNYGLCLHAGRNK